MAIYVDECTHAYGRMLMCHMCADTSEELLAMAACIGIDRRWLQKAGTPREHFDVCKTKRGLAVQYGALAVSSRALVEIVNQKEKAIAQR